VTSCRFVALFYFGLALLGGFGALDRTARGRQLRESRAESLTTDGALL
jgi:hypothetical protein